MNGEPLEAGFENVKIDLKKKLDIYVGQVRETSDPVETKLLCVVTEISNVKLVKGELTLDAKMVPIHLIDKK